ncbi:MAG: cytochrome c biogenesis protein ResB [Sandaracinaceae bacterium]|nr:cytochrome c biogenesis protein ResB [Sandaracinaceae bacterium]
MAVAGILSAAVASMLGFFPGVNWHVLICIVAGASLYNLVLWTRPKATFTTKEAVRQAVVDMGLLTLVLWAAGGMRTPFIGYYVFHIAIVGILVGTRATMAAAIAALAGAVLLLITEHVPALQIGRWDPIWPRDLLAEVAAFTTTVAGWPTWSPTRSTSCARASGPSRRRAIARRSSCRCCRTRSTASTRG